VLRTALPELPNANRWHTTKKDLSLQRSFSCVHQRSVNILVFEKDSTRKIGPARGCYTSTSVTKVALDEVRYRDQEDEGNSKRVGHQ